MQITAHTFLKEIFDNWPETVDVFLAHGFEALGDADYRQRVGRYLTLGRLLQQRQLPVAPFVQQLQQRIQELEQPVDVTMQRAAAADSAEIPAMAGLLPCPVRLPLLEGVAACLQQQGRPRLPSAFAAASSGAEALQEQLGTGEVAKQLPELIVSAGFEVLFSHSGISRLRQQGGFQDLTPRPHNAQLAGLAWDDPQGQFSLLGVVPAVFLVNEPALDGLPCPQSWQDLLQPQWQGRIGLPVGDFDLFTAMLLTLEQTYGPEAVSALGRGLQQGMHPAQMVQGQQDSTRVPPVTIMPYFFTCMAQHMPGTRVVWPRDGAVVSPILMLLQHQAQPAVQAVAQWLAGPEAGGILAQKGLFPSLHPQVANPLPTEAPLLWSGWQTLLQPGLDTRLKQLTNQFNQAHEEVAA